MSLCCHETGRSIEIGEGVVCGTRADSPQYSAVRMAVIDRVPEALRREAPCGDADGIDIHTMQGGDNGGRFYSMGGGKFGEFLFSVSPETALEHLPKLHKTYGTGS